MKLLGTIRHNDRNDDIDRVSLYAGDNGNVWADNNGERYDTGTPIDHVTTAWSGDWDLQLVDRA